MEPLANKIQLPLLKIRSPRTLGCSIIATSLLQSIHRRFPDTKIILYTQTPDLFEGLSMVDQIVDLTINPTLPPYDIDLENYLEERNPQTNEPLRHLSEHIFEIAEEFFGKVTLDRSFPPRLNLSGSELDWAKNEAKHLSNGKKLVWLQTKTSTQTKDVPKTTWDDLVKAGSSRYSFIDLSPATYTRRHAIALTQACFAGVTLDSFLSHGSRAANAKHVILVLVSTHKQVVAYPEQVVIDGLEDPGLLSADTILNILNGLK